MNWNFYIFKFAKPTFCREILIQKDLRSDSFLFVAYFRIYSQYIKCHWVIEMLWIKTWIKYLSFKVSFSLNLLYTKYNYKIHFRVYLFYSCDKVPVSIYILMMMLSTQQHIYSGNHICVSINVLQFDFISYLLRFVVAFIIVIIAFINLLLLSNRRWIQIVLQLIDRNKYILCIRKLIYWLIVEKRKYLPYGLKSLTLLTKSIK